jgi:hypothetical protein
LRDSSGGWTIGEKRPDHIEHTPGPGDYDPKLIEHNEGTATFGMSKVEKGLKIEGDEFEPGPGQYRYYKPETKSKGFTIGERFKEK